MSRRFKSRHGKVTADPHAKPVAPVTLDDGNSFRDPTQPDCRKAKVLNGRAFVRAGVVAELEAAAAAAAAEAERAAQAAAKA